MRIVGESGPAVRLLPGGAETVEGSFPGLVEGPPATRAAHQRVAEARRS